MKGFLFIPEMAVATLRDGHPKTQTRRVMVQQPIVHPVPPYNPLYNVSCNAFVWQGGAPVPDGLIKRYCDYAVGERRCLLTTWAVAERYDAWKPLALHLYDLVGPGGEQRFWHAGMGTMKPEWAGKSRPGRFLPNHLRPLMPMFDVTNVRGERIQDITPADCRAEGMPAKNNDVGVRYAFGSLWNRINESRGFGWDRNPWVWAITFERISS